MATTAILPKGRTACSRGRYHSLKRKNQSLKLHIWFLQPLKAKTKKTKRAISYLRSTEIASKNVNW